MQRINSGRYKSSATIDYRPELFLPIPLAIKTDENNEDYDFYAFLKSVTLNLTPFSDATCNLDYEYVRSNWFDTKTNQRKLANLGSIDYEIFQVEDFADTKIS